MAEYQNTTVSSGELAQRFIEFVMMQAQNAAFMLGQIPHPQTGQAEVNLDMAQLLIDQLVMIQEKTKGNLNSDESRILAGTISNLQMAFVEAVREKPSKRTEIPGTEISGGAGAGTARNRRQKEIRKELRFLIRFCWRWPETVQTLGQVLSKPTFG
jgi:Domain of unknown function (DUF1844)